VNRKQEQILEKKRMATKDAFPWFRQIKPPQDRFLVQAQQQQQTQTATTEGEFTAQQFADLDPHQDSVPLQFNYYFF